MISASSPLQFDDPLPERVDAVIIGAGVIGISTAWFLAKQGVSVLVCEKGRVAGEQSSRNWGWIRQQGRDAAELPIMIDSINVWAGLAKETGEDFGFARHGVMYLADTEAEMAAYARWLDIHQQHQLDTRLLTGAEVDALIKQKPGQWLGALYTPSDGRAEPFKAVPALARAARRAGVAIREGCAVRSLDIQAGSVAGVITEQGRVRAQRVVCAAGAWTSLFVGNLGIDLPQLTVRSTVARTAPAADFFPGNAAAGDLAFRRRADGGYTIAPTGVNEHFVGADSFRHFFKYLPTVRRSRAQLRLHFGDDLLRRLLPTRRWDADAVTPFERTRVLNPPPSPREVRRMHENVARRLPSLANVPFEEAWAGMIDVMPDVVPVIDEVSAHPGLFIATGFSGHGFGIGPGAGRVMADLVSGRRPAHDLTRFRLSRFTDGSKLRAGPGL